MDSEYRQAKAVWIVHWPGNDTPACDEHARKLVGLGRVMGFYVSTTPCEVERLCTNCENEQRSKNELHSN